MGIEARLGEGLSRHGSGEERVAAYAVVDGTTGDGAFTVELWRDPPMDAAHQNATTGDTPELRVAVAADGRRPPD